MADQSDTPLQSAAMETGSNIGFMLVVFPVLLGFGALGVWGIQFLGIDTSGYDIETKLLIGAAVLLTGVILIGITCFVIIELKKSKRKKTEG